MKFADTATVRADWGLQEAEQALTMGADTHLPWQAMDAKERAAAQGCSDAMNKATQ